MYNISPIGCYNGGTPKRKVDTAMTVKSIGAMEVEIRKIEQRRAGECDYALYVLNAEKTEKYLLCVSDTVCGDAELVGGSAQQAKELFRLICDNQASCDHLADIADDYRKLLYKI